MAHRRTEVRNLIVGALTGNLGSYSVTTEVARAVTPPVVQVRWVREESLSQELTGQEGTREATVELRCWALSTTAQEDLDALALLIETQMESINVVEGFRSEYRSTDWGHDGQQDDPKGELVMTYAVWYASLEG